MLPNPNEDFGRPNEPFVETFQNAFPREALFNVSYPKSCTHSLEKCFPGKRILKGLQKVRSAFQNLRLGGVSLSHCLTATMLCSFHVLR